MLPAAQQTRKTNPGNAANAFVRVILSDAGTMLGRMSEDEWQKTLDWFGGRCAYTGEELAAGETDRDHAIPMNRAHCGLHLYGNVLPATRDANRPKGRRKHYRDFVEGSGASRAHRSLRSRVGLLGQGVLTLAILQRYCEAQYRAIDALCRVNRKYLANLLPEADEEDAVADPEIREPVAIDPGGDRTRSRPPWTRLRQPGSGTRSFASDARGLSRTTETAGKSYGAGKRPACPPHRTFSGISGRVRAIA